MNKHINLMTKDLLVCKRMAFFVLYIPVIFLFVPTDSWQSSLLVYYLLPMVMVVGGVLAMYIMEEEKNKGTDLLTTTSYTRKDIVISRYFLCFSTAVLQIVLNLMVMLAMLKSFELFDLLSCTIIFSFICILVSLIVPLSFKFHIMGYGIIYVVIASVLDLLVMSLEVKGRRDNYNAISNPKLLAVGLIIISIISIIISVFISIKIYRKKDL